MLDTKDNCASRAQEIISGIIESVDISELRKKSNELFYAWLCSDFADSVEARGEVVYYQRTLHDAFDEIESFEKESEVCHD